MKNFSIILLLSCYIFSFLACKSDQSKTTTEPAASNKKLTIPKFDRDSAYYFVERQVAFGPRVPNTAAHQATKNWLSDQLRTYGATVIEQDFDAKAYTGEILKGTNIIGQYKPGARKRILLAAHWDSRHITDNDPDETKRDLHVMGADDGASGVGVLLEVARSLQATPIELGVDIVLYDVEDYGDPEGDNPNSWALGSQYWSRNLHTGGYNPKYGILLDMVGAKNPRLKKEGYSMQYAPGVVNKVWKLAQEMGYGNYFSSEIGGGITDDHYFVNRIAGIPMINIINLPNSTNPVFVKHWHTTSDNMEVINKRTLGAVGQVLLAVIYNEEMGRF